MCLLGDARHCRVVDANTLRHFLIRDLFVGLRLLTCKLRSNECIVLRAPILWHLYIGADMTLVVEYVRHGRCSCLDTVLKRDVTRLDLLRFESNCHRFRLVSFLIDRKIPALLFMCALCFTAFG